MHENKEPAIPDRLSRLGRQARADVHRTALTAGLTQGLLGNRGVRGDGAAMPLFEPGAIWPARSRPTLADRFAALLPSADEQC